MKYEDYPCLFKSSDKASLSAQNFYVNITCLYFGLLVSAAFFSGFTLICGTEAHKWFVWLTMISLVLSVILKFIIQIVKWDRKWFDTRVVAESIKMATWRYVMGVEPYNLNLSSIDADKKFISELSEILQSRQEAQKIVSAHLSSGQQISDRMREIRNMNLIKRKEIYLNQRVQDQRKWYESKAEHNGKAEAKWFWIIIATEVLAILVSVHILSAPSNIFNPIGVLITLAAVFAAWTQIKKHRELSQSYTLASQQLASIESLAVHVRDDKTLAEYIISAENVISKEHTMWWAKRS